MHRHRYTRTCKPGSEQLGVFAVRAGRWLSSAPHNEPCAVCVCSAPSSNSAGFRPQATRAHSEARFCQGTHKPGRLGLGSHSGKREAKFAGKSTRISEMHLRRSLVFSPAAIDNVFDIPIRVTEILVTLCFSSLTMAVAETNLPLRSRCCAERLIKNTDKQQTPDRPLHNEQRAFEID